MIRPKVSVLIDSDAFLDTLKCQSILSAEVISWDDDGWYGDLSVHAHEREWTHVRVQSLTEGLQVAYGEFIVGWSAQAAGPDALELLVAAAEADPAASGAMAANFDPLILWRRSAWNTGVGPLAQSQAFAFAGNGSRFWPGSTTVRRPPSR